METKEKKIYGVFSKKGTLIYELTSFRKVPLIFTSQHKAIKNLVESEETVREIEIIPGQIIKTQK
jgi:hypothetical protein